MIAQDEVPVSTVENQGFKDLINILAPGYTVPTRKMIQGRINKMADEMRNKLKAPDGILSNFDNFVLTTDGWTSRANQGYMTTTAHMLSKESWTGCDIVLDTSPVQHLQETPDDMPQCHTIAALQNQLKKVTDNTTALPIACQQFSTIMVRT